MQYSYDLCVLVNAQKLTIYSRIFRKTGQYSDLSRRDQQGHRLHRW